MKRDLIAGLVGAGIMFGAGQAVPAKTTYQTVQDAQAAHLQKYGTYFHVVEYQTPTGEVGYQMFYEDDTSIKSEGTGPEAVSRSYTIEKVATSS
jgi:hypothetical protein